MRVILLENLRNFGSIGDVVDVKRGFARNYLIAQKKALFASKKNINQISKVIKDIEVQLNTRVGTSELNMKFRQLWTKKPPHPFRGKKAKLKYVTQFSTYPPEFSFNLSSRIPKNYYVFLENNIRESYNMKNICFKLKINA